MKFTVIGIDVVPVLTGNDGYNVKMIAALDEAVVVGDREVVTATMTDYVSHQCELNGPDGPHPGAISGACKLVTWANRVGINLSEENVTVLTKNLTKVDEGDARDEAIGEVRELAESLEQTIFTDTLLETLLGKTGAITEHHTETIEREGEDVEVLSVDRWRFGGVRIDPTVFGK